MSRSHSLSFAVRGACLGLLILTLAGCSVTANPPASTSSVFVAGNWQVTAAQALRTPLPSFSGAVSGNSSAVTGIFHANTASTCIAPTVSFLMSGSANSAGQVTLTSNEVAGGTLTLAGKLSPDGRSLEAASYSVTGGSCAMTTSAAATAQQYAAVNGAYTGNFSDSDGQVIVISATFSQTTADQNGNYQLAGTASLPGNPCFTSPVQVTSSVVTGNSFSFTYTGPSANSVSASGTLSPDAATLAVTSWTLSGPRGPDSGTGLLQH